MHVGTHHAMNVVMTDTRLTEITCLKEQLVNVHIGQSCLAAYV